MLKRMLKIKILNYDINYIYNYKIYKINYLNLYMYKINFRTLLIYFIFIFF